jgi:predicted ATP-grasp superfamily ATP-dependent carboligase
MLPSPADVSQRRRRVLLVEEGWGSTLYLARALAPHHDVTVLTASGARGSYRRRGVEWRCASRIDSAALLGDVADAIAAHGVDHVLPLTETAMVRLWAAPGPWTARLFPSTAPWQRALVACKHRLIAYMAARGIAVPRQVAIAPDLDDRARARAIERALGLPVVVKAATGASGTRVRIADTHAALVAALAWARACDGREEWVAQEFVSGPTCLYGGVYDAGRALRQYAGEKLEQHPPRVGPAIRMRSVDHAALVDAGARVMRELAWTGFASADFIRRVDGAFVLLEVNPRLWGSVAAATAAGVDVFAPFVELLAGGRPRAELGFAAGAECRIFPRYLFAPPYRSVRGAVLAARDLFGPQGADWRHPGFALHLVRRLLARGPATAP